MTNGNNYSSQYMRALFDLKRNMINKSEMEKDNIWLEAFNKINMDSIDGPNLPFVLSLIHPDFYCRRGETFHESLPWRKKSNFTAGIRNTALCSIGKLTKVDCLFNEFPEMRGKVEADHIWPNSLGGPSILDNRLLLCKYHNGMKSNDISNFTWEDTPSWVGRYLHTIYYLKK